MIRALAITALFCFLSISLDAQQPVVTINDSPLMTIRDCSNCGDFNTITPNRSVLNQFVNNLINAMDKNSVLLNQKTKVAQLKEERVELLNNLKLAKRDKNNKGAGDINKQINSLDRNIDKEEEDLKKAKNSHKKAQNTYTDSIYTYQDKTQESADPKENLEGILTLSEFYLSISPVKKGSYLANRKSEAWESYRDAEENFYIKMRCEKASISYSKISAEDAALADKNAQTCNSIRAIKNKLISELRKQGDDTAEL